MSAVPLFPLYVLFISVWTAFPAHVMVDFLLTFPTPISNKAPTIVEMLLVWEKESLAAILRREKHV